VAILLLTAPLGCDEGEDSSLACSERFANDSSDPFADCVESFDPDPHADFGHEGFPEVVLGPPGGISDVATLGCGGSIVVFFDGRGVVDGEGADLIVFENPFDTSFPEAGAVSVSEDGEQWHDFPCDPETLTGCAGKTPTEATPGSGLDPTDAAVAGGDHFDLDELGLESARYVRIQDVSKAYWAALEQDYCDPGQGGAGGFDLDAVVAVHVDGHE
jgi:hypothetical protein